MIVSRLLSGALSAAAVLLTACSSSPGVGPLGKGYAPGSICFPGTEGHEVTMGFYVIKNSGTASARIRSITLPNAHGLRATRVWLAPIRKNLLLGAGFPWPPRSPVWAHRMPASGAVIKAGESLNIVFGITRTSSAPARSDGPLVVYTAQGSAYTMRNGVSFEEAAHCS